MKNKCCEKCGKELNFFDRSHQINNERIDIHYDCLCNKCFKVLSGGIDSLNELYSTMITALRDRYHVENMAAVDIDTLIFLAVDAIFLNAPDYYESESIINQALINRSGRSTGPQEDLIRIAEYLIDYGFSINKKNAQIIDFSGYFRKTTLFIEQVGLNTKDDIPKVYYHLFMSCRGFAGSHMETGESFSVAFGENEEIKYQLLNATEIHFTSVSLPDNPAKELILFTQNENQTKDILDKVDQFNEIAKRRKEKKRRDAITIISRGVFRDLKKIQPNEAFSEIPIDCILIFIVKNMMNDPDGQVEELFVEDGLLMDILFENFYENLESFGRTERNEVLDYLKKNTLLSDNFYVQYEKKQEQAWAFFTTRGYILGFLESRKYVYVFENMFPNDIYYPCNDLVYQGCRFLQLAENNLEKGNSGNYRDFEGLIFFSEDIEKIGQMNRFFNLNNIFYVMDRYIEAESQIFTNRESTLEVKRVSDKLFGEFSFLPFCQYDEWAAILEKMKEDDFLLCQIIEQKSKGHKYSPAASTTYTIRIIKAFNRCAKELENTLHFGDLSIAKAILWGYFSGSLIDTLSKEWIRVAGDIVHKADSLVDAFSKYFNMADIESDKSYYLGLYIYYLMSKGILPEDDFLENYEKCIPIYRKYNQSVEYLMFNHAKQKKEEQSHEEKEITDKETTVKKNRFKTKTIKSNKQSDHDTIGAEPESLLKEKNVQIKKETETSNENLVENVTEKAVSDMVIEREKKPELQSEQISMLDAFHEDGIKKPSEILAEMAEEKAKNEQPVHRIIEEK